MTEIDSLLRHTECLSILALCVCVCVCAHAESPEELSFKGGDLIMLKTRYGDEWFRGKLINGAEGIFPKNFVEVVVSVWVCATVSWSLRTYYVFCHFRRSYQLMRMKLRPPKLPALLLSPLQK